MSTTATNASAYLTAEIVNPILSATKATFESMLDVGIERRFLRPKKPHEPFLAITAVVGVTGESTGSVCLSFAEETAFAAAERMMGMPFTEVDELVRDTVGEFANVITGAARLELAELNLEIGLPTVVRGAGHQVDFPFACQPLCAGFVTDLGPILIAFGFVERTKPS